MGDILDFCQGIINDDNLEGVLVPQKDHNINNRLINKKRAEINFKDVFVPLNSTEDNNVSQSIKLRNGNKNLNSDDNTRIVSKNGYINGVENNLVNSISKMSQMIESLENKNKILENEKEEMKKENEKLLKEIKIYKDTIAKFRNHSFDKSDNSIDMKEKDEKKSYVNKNNDEQIKVIFLFKNNKNLNGENKEEILAYKYEMFIEVKLRLLNLRHLGPTDIKACYYNSKEINDWFTLEELNIENNTNVICEFA